MNHHHRWLTALLAIIAALGAGVLWRHSEDMGWLWLPLALGYALCLMPLLPLLTRRD
ncbi:hypothetical protein [Ramlibacter tataouinensis]|uniref:Candidate membrane protein n=1 Tax=Ramlibacter tataouinensis (strain ATCC BAA-407 / DSM 14655 / LMG 21543 / TTB310) TaxID=365046 RepID=F5Y2S8_RAMTT|nr:hypothetical protein [Ramlibacter tataouinensis]AEG93624.1 Hypothetical protein Rta_25260 [Ramlibacter tataouinensis TTB310]